MRDRDRDRDTGSKRDHAHGQTREWDELEKERAAKHRDCLYYCAEEGVFRTSLGPVKVRPFDHLPSFYRWSNI